MESVAAGSTILKRIMLSLLAVRLDVGGPVIGSGILVELEGAFPYMMTAYHVVDHMFDYVADLQDRIDPRVVSPSVLWKQR